HLPTSTSAARVRVFAQRRQLCWEARMSENEPETTPQMLVNTEDLLAAADDDAAGAVWKLQQPHRDLDSNVIALPAAGRIERHPGPHVDVLSHVLAGAGTLHTAAEDRDLRPGGLIWMPKG